MKTSIKKTLQSLLLVPAMVLGVGAALPVGVAVLNPDNAAAQTPKAEIEKGVVSAGGGADSDGSTFKSLIKTVIDTLLFIIGAVAVIMLIYGGFRYVTSAGDASAVTAAKNTILYAVIGLIVALLSYAIIGYVLSQFGG